MWVNQVEQLVWIDFESFVEMRMGAVAGGSPLLLLLLLLLLTKSREWSGSRAPAAPCPARKAAAAVSKAS